MSVCCRASADIRIKQSRLGIHAHIRFCKLEHLPVDHKGYGLFFTALKRDTLKAFQYNYQYGCDGNKYFPFAPSESFRPVKGSGGGGNEYLPEPDPEGGFSAG